MNGFFQKISFLIIFLNNEKVCGELIGEVPPRKVIPSQNNSQNTNMQKHVKALQKANILRITIYHEKI